MLTGTEVKSLRDGKAQIKDAYAPLRDGEVWLIGLYIPPYGAAARENHDPERPRKLLLHRARSSSSSGRTQENGADARPDADLLLRPPLAREGRDRAGQGQEPVRQARVDRATRDMARDVQRELREAGR